MPPAPHPYLEKINVSHETIEKFDEYIAILKKWQKTINLVGPSTLNDIYVRHIVDSAQLIEYIDKNNPIYDLGSGAGFPGMVLSVLGCKKITLIESDERKAAFLREVSRQLSASVSVVNQRVESILIEKGSTMVARAFASVSSILSSLGNNLTFADSLLLLKGKSAKNEIKDAKKLWDFKETLIPSITDTDGYIVELTNIQKRGEL